MYYTADDRRYSVPSLTSHIYIQLIFGRTRSVLTVLKNCDCIDTIHFISDSPSTQYKSVKNLYLTMRNDSSGAQFTKNPRTDLEKKVMQKLGKT